MIDCKAFAIVWEKSVCCVKKGKSTFEIFVSSMSFMKTVKNLKSSGKQIV